MKKKRYQYKFDHTTPDGQKRLMAIACGQDSETYISKPIKPFSGADYGCDPAGDNKFKMIPSGDIVDYEEMRKKLGK